MKRFTFLSFFLFSFYLIGMSQDNPLYEPLSTLELDSISTGFLYDHTFSWGSMALFNGSYQDTLQNTKTNWLQLHLDLERSVMDRESAFG